MCIKINHPISYFKAARELRAGKGWYDMNAPEMDEEKKNELTLLTMRSALDPKRFYKAPDKRGLPKYFEVSFNVYTMIHTGLLAFTT